MTIKKTSQRVAFFLKRNQFCRLINRVTISRKVDFVVFCDFKRLFFSNQLKYGIYIYIYIHRSEQFFSQQNAKTKNTYRM